MVDPVKPAVPAPVKPAAPAPSFAQMHTVVSGDTLGKIAKQYYGDPSLYMTIFDANKDQLNDPNMIKVGQKLRIP